MSRLLHSDLKHDWKEISDKVSTVSGAIYDLEIELLLELPETEGKEQQALTTVVDRLSQAYEALRGLPYLCTPQSEWMGGDEWKVRAPHIVSDQK